MELLNTSLWILFALLIVGVVVGITKFSRLGKAQKLLTSLMLAALIAETCSFILRKSGNTNYPIFHIYVIVEFALFTRIYASQIKNIRWIRLLRWSVILMLIYALVNVFFWQSLSSPNTNVTTVYSLVMILLSAQWFFMILREMKYDSLFRSSFFWINNGVLLYYSSSFVLFVFMFRVSNLDYHQIEIILYLNMFFNLIHYLCFNIALWMNPE